MKDWDLPARAGYFSHAVPSKPTPKFVPNLYRRHPRPRNLAPGDEVWVQYNSIVLVDGRPALGDWVDTYDASEESPLRCMRIRVYTDETLELGCPEGSLISSNTAPRSMVLPIHRVVNLNNTGDVRTFTWPEEDEAR